jgi:hypothetical protein
MQQMQSLFGNPEGLSVEAMFSKYKLCQHVPYWRDNPEAQKWMSERRACPETQRQLPVIENAVECVSSLEAETGIKVRGQHTRGGQYNSCYRSKPMTAASISNARRLRAAGSDAVVQRSAFSPRPRVAPPPCV